MRDIIKDAIRAHIQIPAHIVAMASACAYDLYNGPSFSQKPASGKWEDFTEDDYATFAEDLEGEIVETYSGAPGAMLRAFLSELPGDLYVLENCGTVCTGEPEGEWLNRETCEPCDSDDDEAEWYEPEPYYTVDHQDIIEALFGRTIAREFY